MTNIPDGVTPVTISRDRLGPEKFGAAMALAGVVETIQSATAFIEKEQPDPNATLTREDLLSVLADLNSHVTDHLCKLAGVETPPGMYNMGLMTTKEGDL
ncbi:hypothetical protein [Kocuria sp.]|uniref:hypothetical protein n=1 Tax=Kocuria sp. TaxID=1871328 RepID=UPI0026DF2EE1|nr:hypothetical protein [Kocuria sp.]MDO5618032.1 hypothetical protein [Kocuria sp.]